MSAPPLQHRRLLAAPHRDGLPLKAMREVFWIFLLPITWVYASYMRHRRQRSPLLKPCFKAPVPVISVGNIHVGGSGKTPIVALIAKHFEPRRVAVLSRGYGTKPLGQAQKIEATNYLPSTLPDEPMWIAKTAQCPVWVHPNRALSARAALAEGRVGVFILDDGFQHQRIHKDIELVLINTRRPCHDYTLPLGPLREGLSSLRQATALVLVQPPQSPPSLASFIIDWEDLLKPLGIPVFRARRRVEGIWNAKGLVEGRLPVTAFCGIADPDGFFEDVRLVCDLEVEYRLRDHAHYSPHVLSQLLSANKKRETTHYLTTEKDYSKAAPFFEARGLSLHYVKIGYEMESAFWSFLENAIA